MLVNGFARLTALSSAELPVRQRGVCCDVLGQVDRGWAQETAEVLKALAEPTRLSMLAALWEADGPVCICDFTAAFELTQPTISHHMARLKAAGLVESTRRGIWIYYRLNRDLAPEASTLLSGLFGAPQPPVRGRSTEKSEISGQSPTD
jgi:ArsR family transcriptional regulator